MARTSSARPARSTSTSRWRSSSARARCFEGAKWVCSTPLRSRAEGHQDAMWQALRTNDLQMVSTDHCPFCMKDQKELGLGDFRAIPNGIGSIEHRMDLMYSGCGERPDLLVPLGGADLDHPGADVRALRPQGRDPAGRRRRHRDLRPERATPRSASSKTHHMNMDHSAWEGYEIDGHVDRVMSRGTVDRRRHRLRRHQGPRRSSSSAA